MSPTDLREHFDAVVMLTWSDWKTEPRSNRYHYATRFARHLPVYFVQTDHPGPGYDFEPTEVPDLTLLHLCHELACGARPGEQVRLLGQALGERRVVRPLLWVYNAYLHHFARTCFAPLKVYHATEDYFGDPGNFRWGEPLRHGLRDILRQADLVVAVSAGVAEQYRQNVYLPGRIVVAANGCDHAFFSQSNDCSRPERPVACYQGGINERLDLDLLHAVAGHLPEWDFVFLGKAVFAAASRAGRRWKELLRLPNVSYLGEKRPEEVRRLLHGATVGIIPFAPNESIWERSFPLKAFEYVACGLPVVSTPLRQLLPWQDLFAFTADPEAFARAIAASPPLRHDPAWLARRDAAAREQSYDARFAGVCQAILEQVRSPHRATDPLRVLVLHDAAGALEPYRRYYLHSRNHVSYAACTGDAACPYDLSYFDAVVLCPGVVEHLSAEYAEALRSYPGLKVSCGEADEDLDEVLVGQLGRVRGEAVPVCLPAPPAEALAATPLPSSFRARLRRWVEARWREVGAAVRSAPLNRKRQKTRAA